MNVYWFQDSKAGHIKQVKVLLDQLKKEIEFSIITINYSNKESFSKMLAAKGSIRWADNTYWCWS
jgi:hypothetical protein